MVKTLLFALLIFFSFSSFSQFSHQQYFDGADTNSNNSILIKIDTTNNQNNVWQIGPPQKNLFNAASTSPNAIITDTINYYPPNDTSSFTFGINNISGGWVLAVQWNQKLDMDHNLDGGIIEVSVDSGQSWINIIHSPYTYNFYGFDYNNIDTLPNNEYCFSGTDTNWRNIWACFDLSWIWPHDSVMMKFTLKSDSLDNNKEGWLIDNFMVGVTYVHTVNEIEQEELIKVNPTITNNRVHIKGKHIDEPHYIKSLELIDIQGRVLKNYGRIPLKFYIDMDNYPDGIYFIKVESNLKTETFKVILKKN